MQNWRFTGHVCTRRRSEDVRELQHNDDKSTTRLCCSTMTTNQLRGYAAAQWRQINYAVTLQHNDDKSTTRLRCSTMTNQLRGYVAAQWRQINYAVMLQHNDDKSTTRLRCSTMTTNQLRMLQHNDDKSTTRLRCSTMTTNQLRGYVAAQWRQINYAVMLQHNDDKSTTRLCSQTTPVRMCTGNEMKDAVRGLHHGTTSEYAWNDHRKWRHISAEIKCAFFEITRVPLEFKLRYSFFSLSYTVINSDYSLEWYSKHSLYVKHTLHIKCE